jgi:hypothetical protein
MRTKLWAVMLCVGLSTSAATTLAQETSEAPRPAGAPFALRVPATLVGGALGAGIGFGIGAGLVYLGLEATAEPATEYDEYGEAKEGCPYGCNLGWQLLVLAIGIPVALVTTAIGMGLGTWGTGELLGGRGGLENTFVGMAFGGITQLCALIFAKAFGADEDTMLYVLAGGTAFTLAGGVIGYAWSDWQPIASVAPDGRGAYVGVKLAF